MVWQPTGIIHNGEVCHKRWITLSDGSKEQTDDICININYNFDWQDPEWTNKYTFNMDNPDCLLTEIKNKRDAVTINEKTFITYDIDNKITTLSGGAIIKEKSNLFSPAKSTKEERFGVYEGKNNYRTEVSSVILGDNNIFIKPFVIVNNVDMGTYSDVILYSNSDEKVMRTLPNIENIPTQTQDFWNRNPVEEITIGGITKINQESDNNMLILIIIIIGGLILYAKKR
jgi:glutamyl/glutaminyl-tRNA synthetase